MKRVVATLLCAVLGCAEANTDENAVELPPDRDAEALPGDDAEPGWDIVRDDTDARDAAVSDVPTTDAAASDAPTTDGAIADAPAMDVAPPRDLPIVTDLPAPQDLVTPRDAPPPPRCGDGFIDPGEVCDGAGDTSACAPDCRSVQCSFARAYTDPATRRCYWRETSVVRRADAVARCESQGAALAVFETEGERGAVYPNMGLGGSNRVWIALQRRNGAWQWDNGAPLAYTGFRSGEPSGDGDCVEWGPADSFNDVGCSNSRDYVCERAPPGRPR